MLKLSVIIWALMAAPGYAEVISWPQVKADALAHAEDLAINRVEQAIIHTQTREAKAEYHPQIRLRASVERLENLDKQQALPPITVVGNSSFVNQSLFQASPGATVNLTLWDGGQRKRRIQETRHRLSQKTEAGYTQQRDILLKALSAYTEALHAQTRKAYLIKLIKGYDTLAATTKRLYDAGLIRKTDLADVALESYSAKEDLARAEQDLTQALIQLGHWTHMSYDPTALELDPLNGAVTVTIQPEQLPEFRQYTEAMHEKTVEIERLKRERWAPVVNGYANLSLYGRNNDRLFQALRDTDFTNLTVGVTAQWLVWDGHRLSAQIDRAKLEKERLALLRTQAVREVMTQQAVEAAKSAQLVVSAKINTMNERENTQELWLRLGQQKLVAKTDVLKQWIAKQRDALQLALTQHEQAASVQRLQCYEVGLR